MKDRTVRTLAICRPCLALQPVVVEYERRAGLLIHTRWACEVCGAVVYEHQWEEDRSSLPAYAPPSGPVQGTLF